MGTFSIASKRDQDTDALTSTVSISDADIDRITVAYAHIYFPNGVTEGEGEAAVTRAPTGTEVFQAVANGLLQGLIANTVSWEKSDAARQAQENVPPINVGPITDPV